MSELEVQELHLRWKVDTRIKPIWNNCVQSSAVTCRGGEWNLCYFYSYSLGDHVLRLKKVAKGIPDPFDVSVYLERGDKGRISTDLSRKTHCTYGNCIKSTILQDPCNSNAHMSEEGALYYWAIWSGSDLEIARSNPEFRRDFHLRFLVFIRERDTTPTDNPFACPLCQSTPIAHQATSLTSTPCLESLSEDFSRMLVANSDHDVKLKCGGKSIGVHGAVVSARSPVIGAMLASGIEEDRTRVVNIPDVDPDIFKHFLRYIYTGKVPELTFEVALSLYKLGDQYVVLGLAKRCSQYLLEHLSVQNAIDVLVVAAAHGREEFKEAVIDFMVVNKVPQVSSRWKDFCSDHTTLAIEVLNRICDV